MLKESFFNSWYPSLRGQCGEACLELGFGPVPKQAVLNVLQRIFMKPITYENALPVKNKVFLSENQINSVEDIIVKRDTANLGMSRKEVIQVISEISQANLFVQA